MFSIAGRNSDNTTIYLFYDIYTYLTTSVLIWLNVKAELLDYFQCPYLWLSRVLGCGRRT